MELQCRFLIVEVGAANNLTNILDTISRLSEALLFNRVGKESSNTGLSLSKVIVEV